MWAAMILAFLVGVTVGWFLCGIAAQCGWL